MKRKEYEAGSVGASRGDYGVANEETWENN